MVKIEALEHTTSRRRVLSTGAKIAYVTPVVLAAATATPAFAKNIQADVSEDLHEDYNVASLFASVLTSPTTTNRANFANELGVFTSLYDQIILQVSQDFGGSLSSSLPGAQPFTGVILPAQEIFGSTGLTITNNSASTITILNGATGSLPAGTGVTLSTGLSALLPSQSSPTLTNNTGSTITIAPGGTFTVTAQDSASGQLALFAGNIVAPSTFQDLQNIIHSYAVADASAALDSSTTTTDITVAHSNFIAIVEDTVENYLLTTLENASNP